MCMTSFIQSGLFSVAIAVLVWWLTDLGAFPQVLFVSLSVGWSVNLAFVLLHDRLIQGLGPWLAPACIISLGLGSGLLIGGTLVSGQPLHFFSHDSRTFALGLFFAVNGFLVFGTFKRLRNARQELDAAALKQTKQEKLLAETELKLLQAQIEPHFLFNSLSNLAQHIRSDPDLAVKTVEHLSVLLRSALSRTLSGDSTLGQEIDFASAYLAVQAMRMQGRMRYRLELQDGIREIPLPPLLIQPVLENAVIHGIDAIPCGGEIVLSARQVNDKLILTVSDNGAGISEFGSSDGSGLRNVRERLRLRYGSSASLDLATTSSRGVKVLIRIPLGPKSGRGNDGSARIGILQTCRPH